MAALSPRSSVERLSRKSQLIERFYEQARRMLSRKRRSRSCPRAMRQPVSSWPRLLINKSFEGPLRFAFV